MSLAVILAEGCDVGVGNGMRLRTAIMPATVKAHVVKKPKAVCRRLREECMVGSGQGRPVLRERA